MAASIIFGKISLGGTLGVTFLGVCMSSMLYGITCLQTFTYYRSARAKSDAWALWGLVAILLVLDSAHQATIMHAVYNDLVLDFANPFKVIKVVWSIPTELVLTVILSLIINGFLTFRLWKLSTNYYLIGIASVLTLGNFGTNFAFAMRSYLYNDIFAAETVLRPQGISGLSLAAINEAMLSFSLAYFLHARRTGLRKSNDIITKLIGLTVATGMLTTFANVADLIAYVAARDNLYVLFFTFVAAKLYPNSLLTSLNSRDYVLGLTGDGSGSSDHQTLGLPPSLSPPSSDVNTGLAQSGGWHCAQRVAPSHAVHIAMESFSVVDPTSDTMTKYESV